MTVCTDKDDEKMRSVARGPHQPSSDWHTAANLVLPTTAEFPNNRRELKKRMNSTLKELKENNCPPKLLSRRVKTDVHYTKKKTNPTCEVRVGRTRGMRKEDFRLSPSQKGLSYQHLVWGRTCIFLRKTRCGLLETKSLLFNSISISDTDY